MKYTVTIAEDYPRPLATFFGLPAIKPGRSKKLELTKLQAWSLNNKNGVTVTGAPTEDPRPWEERCQPTEEHSQFRELKLAVGQAKADLRKVDRTDKEDVKDAEEALKDAERELTSFAAKKNAALKAKSKAKADTEKAETPSTTKDTTKAGGKS
ncbi:hypothetical protein N9X87_00530 [bacterium]|nr:hypothetical protein [bacterium]